MPKANFVLTSSGIVISAPTGVVSRKHIKIKLVWFEIAEISGQDPLVSLRWGENGEDFFPKTRVGLAVANLVGLGNDAKGPEHVALWMHINGNAVVRGTIAYEYF